MYRLEEISCPQYAQWPASVWGCPLKQLERLFKPVSITNLSFYKI